MIPGKSSGLPSAFAIVLFFVLGNCPTSVAQGPLPESPTPIPGVEHASAFVSLLTRSNLQSGGRELNPVVQVFGRSTPGLAANFIGETAGVVSLSYFFHKTGHHKLERWVSAVNISSSAGAVGYGLTHR